MKSKLLYAALAILLTINLGQAQTSSFTYQGRLTESAAPANGTYEMQFSLWTAANGGTQVGTTILNNNVNVAGGVFTVDLDFATGPFNTGADRFLEIAVRKPTDPPGYTTLTPRQQLATVPFAIRSQSAALADSLGCVLCVTDGQIVGIGSSKITGVLQVNQGGTGSATQNFVDLSTAQIVNGAKTFTSLQGSGSGLTNLSPSNITAGTATINVNGIAARAAISAAGSTPSVSNLTMLVLNYNSPTAITDLTGGIDAQCVVLVALTANASIADAGNFRLTGNWTPLADDTLTVCRTNASGTPRWYERARSANTTPPNFILNVTRSGSGTVASEPNGIYCGVDCSHSYSAGSVVALTATPDAGVTFVGWGGACSGTSGCIVTMDAAKNVVANFGFSLTVEIDDEGDLAPGTVTSQPAGINCGLDCTEAYNASTVVTLTATPGANVVFNNWSGGGCSGSGTCQVTMDQSKTVTAIFRRVTHTLGVSLSGDGLVISTPDGIQCEETGGDCSEPYPHGTNVSLEATADPGWTFTGWSGACTGTGICNVTMDQSRNVTATFTQNQFALTVSRTGTGNGTVTSNPAGINCGVDCNENYSVGTVVDLTATPAAGSSFSGWGGACTGTGACQVTMSQARSVSATFTINTHQVFVTRAGTGGGVVASASSPNQGSQINCGATCSVAFNHASTVVLTASPDSTSIFAGWSGCPSPSGNTCTISNLTSAQSVTATFTRQFRTLSVFTAGVGIGTVTSNPAGISCGSDCTEDYILNTSVVLAATPNGSSVFASWSSCPSPSGNQCTVIMSSAASVTATFNSASPSRTVNNVTSSTPNGSYNAGDIISIQVQYSGAVDVAGTPQIALNSGGGAAGMYSNGSGTNTLTFNYLVATGQNSPDLDYVSTGSLTLSGGTINNAGTNLAANNTLPNPASLNSLGGAKSIVIDTLAPTVTINQHPSQSDPGTGSTVTFRVVFSEVIEPSSFSATDVQLSGTAGGTLAKSICASSGGTTFSICVTGMTSGGTVIATIPAGAVADFAGNLTSASTSTDNTITWSP